ncbi:Rab GTPase binding [Homalodisca vitripennis]|nr:Rab GTPase binding [Homalodisca vitripennis]
MLRTTPFDFKSISLPNLHVEDENSNESYPQYAMNGTHLDLEDCDEDEKNSYHSHTFQPLDSGHQSCLDMGAGFEGLELMDLLNYSALNSDLTQADKLRFMEEQQEKLNSNLIALSTHFAQVQLRLKQIVDAPPSEKEVLLKNLEEFAFSGIPEVSSDISGSLLLSNP